MKITYLTKKNLPDGSAHGHVYNTVSGEHEIRETCSIMLNLSGFISSDIVILRFHNITRLFIQGIIARLLRKQVVIEVDSYINFNSRFLSSLLRFYLNYIAAGSLTHVIAYSAEDSYALRGLTDQKLIKVHFLRPCSPEDEKHVRIQKDILIHIDLDQYTLEDKNLDLVTAIAMKMPEMNFLVAVAGIPAKSEIHYLRNMPPNCHFIPANPGVNLSWVLERSVVYLDLSEKSRDDLNLQRALSAGLAPVVTDSGNLCKIIGRSGCIVSLSDGLDTIVEIISSTCNSAEKYAKNTASEDCSHENFKNAMLDVLKEVTLGAKHPA